MTANNLSVGRLRWPAALTPSVGFLAFIAAEAARSPTTGSGDGIFLLLPILIIVNLVAFLPSLLGAVSLLLLFRVLPPLAQSLVVRPFVGALVGALLGFPFAYVLNGMEASGDASRFNYLSMVIGSAVAGGFCAVFYSVAEPVPLDVGESA